MSDSEQRPDILPQRLCGEIQLFDLCDRDICSHKSNRFCTDPDLLNRFEKIAEQELRVSERYLSDEIEDSDADDDEYEEEDEYAAGNDEGEDYDDREDYE